MNSVEKYKSVFPNFLPDIDTGYQLLRYTEGQDSFVQQQRSVSCTINLNDDFEGGEFAFFDRELIFYPNKGSVLMFPSNFMYPHEVMPVKKGTRYSIITWYV
jgi:predicted 2-oxoglutarate/Fe(II)-dependent dioxygenase YbiX